MFDNKTHYNKHLLRKIPCKKLINTILHHDAIYKNEEVQTDNKLSKMDNKIDLQDKKDNFLSILDKNINDYIYDENKTLKCILCGKIYKHLSGLCKHKKQKHQDYEIDIKKINIQKNEKSEIEKFKELIMTQIENLNEKNKQLDEKNKQLDEKNKQLELLVKTSKSKNITNNINNTTNNGQIINNNINIVQFGREDSNLLSKEEISKILYERGVDGLLASIEVFHFNNRLPQYKNIRLTNLKSKYIDVHNGKKWIKENQDKVLNDTLENHTYHLQTICDDTGNSKRIKNSVKNIINDYSEANKLDTVK